MYSTQKHSAPTVESLFIRYVSQNILGMLGISAYVLADTFFIAKAAGANGITALNLVLPVYSLIFAIGNMIGTGSATRFTILRAQKEASADSYFSHAVICSSLAGLIFTFMGILIPGQIMRLLGANAEILAVGIPYTRIFLLFGPFFMLNYVYNAFVRNDGNPSLAMIATLSSSLFNIVMDYLLMFPLGMGMAGAALATAISPVVGICICSIHFISGKASIHFRPVRLSFHKLIRSCQLGVSAFVGEIASGITTIVFNFLILDLSGNTGVAAYGIVANTALVATAIFNGVSQGGQPLFSNYYGKGEKKAVRKTLMLSLITAFSLAAVLITAVYLMTDPIIYVFNSENNPQMASYAFSGLRLYFLGFLFASLNIVGTGYLSATEKARSAFITSTMRGFAAIIFCAFTMARIWGMYGVWLAFPAAEAITFIVMLGMFTASSRIKPGQHSAQR